MNEESRMLQQTARAVGILIHDSLAGNPELSWELEDSLKMTLSTESASIAALTLIYALSQTHREHPDHRAAILRHWEHIVMPQSQFRFVPMIPLALRLLRAVPQDTAPTVVRILINIAQRTKDPGRIADIIQGLVEDRKQLGVYHTMPASATLMAHLAVPEDEQRWSNPRKTADFRMADYACGCGELLTAAYRRLRDLHQAQGQDPSGIHHQMITNSITALDILPASVAIAATELDLLEAKPKGTPSGQTRALTLQMGPITNHQRERETPAEAGMKPKQRQVGLGSLDLLDPGSLRHQERQPMGRKFPQKNLKPMDLSIQSQDLVIMNPPYTRPAGAALMDRNIPGGKLDIPPTSPGELRKMEIRMRRVRDAAHAGTRNGMALYFSHIADQMVKPGGTIALLLPMSAVTTYNEKINSSEGWSSFRRQLVEGYRNIRIISITGFEDYDSNFSHDTGIAEVMLIAQRTHPGEHPDGAGHFINLARRPGSSEEAAQLAIVINQATTELEQETTGNTREIILNGKKEGIAIRTEISEKEIWPMVRVLDPGLIQAAEELSRGMIRTAPGKPPAIIPTTLLEQVAVHGNPTPSIDSYLGQETPGKPVYAVLRQHNCTTQRALEVQANEKMSPRDGREVMERKLEQLMSRLHINDNFRYNSQPTAACMTPEPSIGGKSWPNIVLREKRQEKALAVWLNTSLGLITHWSRSNRTQNGLGYLSRRQTGNLPVLDVTQLTNRQLNRMEEIFEQVKDLPMLPANEAWKDPIRAELDRRVLTEALELEQETVDRTRDLRNRWCLEPTVQARKGGSVSRQQDMHKLRELVGTGGTTGWEEEILCEHLQDEEAMATQRTSTHCTREVTTLVEPVTAQIAEPKHLMVAAAKMAVETQPVQPAKHLMVAAAKTAVETQPVQPAEQTTAVETKRTVAVAEQPSAVAVAEQKTSAEQPIAEVEPETPAEPTPPPLPDKGRSVRNKPEILRELSDIFQFEVHAVCKTMKNSMEYNIRTEYGPVHIGSVSNILKQKAFRNIIADTLNRVVPEQKPARSWEQIAEKILQASVKVRHRATNTQRDE